MNNKILCPTLKPFRRGKIILLNHEEGDDMPWLASWDGSSSWWLFETKDLYAFNIHQKMVKDRVDEDFIRGWDYGS